ncbi:Dephospho-CoA kinase [bioreactor metagenome]|uniref:Dephospho-CoA kinase n=1 Tax=bioreactor metagenome TaxID=1076179 RepID=A0A645CK91_9ZZZZ
MVIGLTGKTGSGKTTVSSLLKEKGFYIIDGDKIAREITLAGSPVLIKLQNAFGEDILGEDGTLNRKLLSFRAFSSRENTEKLNNITHPAIRKIIAAEISKAQIAGYDGIIVDAAALLDSDCKDDCEYIAVVHAPEDIRLTRIMARDNLDRTTAKIRMNAQKSDDFYLSHADIILTNDAHHHLQDEIEKFIKFFADRKDTRCEKK